MANLVETYKRLLSELLVLRAAQGRLSNREEGRLAREMADIWEELDSIDREKLEEWIDLKMKPVDRPNACADNQDKKINEIIESAIHEMSEDVLARREKAAREWRQYVIDAGLVFHDEELRCRIDFIAGAKYEADFLISRETEENHLWEAANLAANNIQLQEKLDNLQEIIDLMKTEIEKLKKIK